MCGIVGYIGYDSTAIKTEMQGLYRLEYRGFESAGLAYVDEAGMHVFRAKGAVAGLDKKC